MIFTGESAGTSRRSGPQCAPGYGLSASSRPVLAELEQDSLISAANVAVPVLAVRPREELQLHMLEALS